MLQGVEGLLTGACPARPARKGGELHCSTQQGYPIGDIIVNYAEQNEIDLIAIATHGHSGLARMVFGSVADFVLKNSGHPILVITPKETEQQ